MIPRPLLYLATPYSKYPGGLDAAFRHASNLAARLVASGAAVYSPIAHCHPLALYGGLDPLDYKIWLPYQEVMMAASNGLLIAKMTGWGDSLGIHHEIDRFVTAGKRMHFVDPVTLNLEPIAKMEARRLVDEYRNDHPVTAAER
jgi:hypothetical protein